MPGLHFWLLFVAESLRPCSNVYVFTFVTPKTQSVLTGIVRPTSMANCAYKQRMSKEIPPEIRRGFVGRDNGIRRVYIRAFDLRCTWKRSGGHNFMRPFEKKT